MKLIVLVISWCISVSAYCSQVACDYTLGGVCYTSQSDLISVNVCGTGQVCAANQMYSTLPLLLNSGPQYCVTQYYVPEPKVDGEDCESDRDCSSGDCTLGKCIGLGVGIACNSTDECKIGYSCQEISNSSMTCSLIRQDEQSCSADTDCTNDSACYLSRCGKYFSLSVGSYVADASSLICDSGYVEFGFCAQAPQNLNSADQECLSSSDCVLSDSYEVSSCECGLNTQGYAYCAAVPGDSEFSDLKSALLQLTGYNQLCHTSIRFSERCPQLALTKYIQEFLTAYYTYQYRPYTINAPSCVVNSLVPFASNYDSTIGGGSGSSIDTGTVLVLAIVLPFFIVTAGLCSYFLKRAYNTSANNRSQPSETQMRQNLARSMMIHQPPRVEVQNQLSSGVLGVQAGQVPLGIPLAIATNPTTFEAEDTFSEYHDGIITREKGAFDDEESASSKIFVRVRPPHN